MTKRKINVTIEEMNLVTPGVYWEKIFFFGGGDGHLIIYGHHNGGGFFAIPNYNICCEACENSYSTDWNRSSLISAGVRKEYAAAIAEYVNDYNVKYAAEINAIRKEDNERTEKFFASRGFRRVDRNKES